MKRKTKTIDPKIKKELENGTYHMKYRDFDIDIILIRQLQLKKKVQSSFQCPIFQIEIK